MTLPGDVGWTGLMTAHMRAIESARQDRLFDDPLATAVDLVRNAVRTDPDVALPTGPEGDRGELTETWYMLSTFLCVRTPYYDSRSRRHAPSASTNWSSWRRDWTRGPTAWACPQTPPSTRSTPNRCCGSRRAC
ncbi:hypothetical protein ACWEWG_38415 [Streptomyces sp. NPDC003758]